MCCSSATLLVVKRLVRLLLLGLLVLLAFFAGRFSSVLLRPPLIVSQDAAVAGVAPALATVSFNPNLGGFIDVSPRTYDTLFIFYSGGLVRPQAYTWLGVALAPYGVRMVIPVFPFDLAVTAADRAQQLLPLADGKPVVVGGHSLGGVAAARFVRRHPDAAQGLVLLGAFSAEGDDLGELPVEVVVLAAEHDGLAALPEVRSGLARLPADSSLHVIGGSVHSFFGRYGPQAGDGLPSVTRAAAEQEILRVLRRFFARF